jgi:hypothetical protein
MTQSEMTRPIFIGRWTLSGKRPVASDLKRTSRTDPVQV